jgi:hypothetical protein
MNDVVHQCMCCKRKFTGPEWARLVMLKTGTAPVVGGLEYRDCPCGNTMTMLVCDVDQLPRLFRSAKPS